MSWPEIFFYLSAGSTRAEGSASDPIVDESANLAAKMLRVAQETGQKRFTLGDL